MPALQGKTALNIGRGSGIVQVWEAVAAVIGAAGRSPADRERDVT
jgi:hypothetical protein